MVSGPATYFHIDLIVIPFLQAHVGALAVTYLNYSSTSTGKYLHQSGSVVECLTRDQGAAGSSLTNVTALCSLSKTHLS